MAQWLLSLPVAQEARVQLSVADVFYVVNLNSTPFQNKQINKQLDKYLQKQFRIKQLRRNLFSSMGNNLRTFDSKSQIQKLQASEQGNVNLKTYLWRSSSDKNQYVSRVKFNFPQQSVNQKCYQPCSGVKDSPYAHIQFQNYVSDFRVLKGYLSIQELIFVFQSVLKGHQSIYQKFDATLVNQKSSFVTHDGEIRIWINPNYYLNQFWSVPKKQFKLKDSLTSQIGGQTPRFMNRQQFDLQTISSAKSQSEIIRRIVQFMHEVSNECEITVIFWSQLDVFLQANTLNNCSFKGIYSFLNKFSYFYKITFRSNIKKVVERLISEGKILKQQSETNFNYKSTKVGVAQQRTKNSQSGQNNQNQGNQANQFNGVAAVNIKNNTARKIYDASSNLNKSLATTYHKKYKQDKQKVNGMQEQLQNFKTSIKQKRFGHQRRQSKSFVQLPSTNVVQPIDNQVTSFVRSEAYNRPQYQKRQYEIRQRTKSKSFLCDKIGQNLKMSQQFSINFHTGPEKHIRQEQSGQGNSSKPALIINSFQMQKLNNNIAEGNVAGLNNTHNGTKSKIRQMGSIQVQNNDNFKSDDQKKTILFLPRKNTQKQIQLTNRQSKKIHVSNLSIQSDQKYYIFQAFKQQAETKRKLRNKQQIVVNSARTRHQIPVNNQNQIFYSTQDTGKLQQIVFKQMQSFKESIQLTTINKCNQNSSTDWANFGTGHCNRQKKVQNSILTNAHADQQVMECIIKSKRRISASGAQFKNIHKNGKHKMAANHRQSMGYSMGQNTNRTVTGLFSQDNDFQKSQGSLSSNELSERDQGSQKYSGILSKMGRSVTYIKVQAQQSKFKQQYLRRNAVDVMQQMSDFTKKRSIYDQGTNRSLIL